MQKIQPQLSSEGLVEKLPAKGKHLPVDATHGCQENDANWRKTSPIRIRQPGKPDRVFRYPLIEGGTVYQRRRRMLRNAGWRRRIALGARLNRHKGEQTTKEFIFKNCEVDPQTGCWNWKRAIGKSGYGIVRIAEHSSAVSVHRVSYSLWHPEVNITMCVCHHCDNKKCCNPDHLFLGTHRDNVRDAMSKGRMAWQK